MPSHASASTSPPLLQRRRDVTVVHFVIAPLTHALQEPPQKTMKREKIAKNPTNVVLFFPISTTHNFFFITPKIKPNHVLNNVGKLNQATTIRKGIWYQRLKPLSPHNFQSWFTETNAVNKNSGKIVKA